MTGKSLEDKVRRLAKRQGYLLRKSRGMICLDNFGEYMLVDSFIGACITGDRYDATLEEIQEFINEN